MNPCDWPDLPQYLQFLGVPERAFSSRAGTRTNRSTIWKRSYWLALVLLETTSLLVFHSMISLQACGKVTVGEQHSDSPILAENETKDIPLFKRKVLLHGKWLELHLAGSQQPNASDLLVLYASGDGGWFGTAVKMFRDLTRFGYPSVGFSAKSYIKLLAYGDHPVSVGELCNDYQEIIHETEALLKLPQTTRTILTGWSRGAAFAVLVGSERIFQHDLAGVIAIGLPDKEELKIKIHGKQILVANISSKHREQLTFDTYQRIPLIAPLPFTLIQSTGDDFLPASDARKLFGTESETAKFFAVEAHNHRFSGGTAAFNQSLCEAMQWITKGLSAKSEYDQPECRR